MKIILIIISLFELGFSSEATVQINSKSESVLIKYKEMELLTNISDILAVCDKTGCEIKSQRFGGYTISIETYNYIKTKLMK